MRRFPFHSLGITALLWACMPAICPAQAPGVPIESSESLSSEASVMEQATALKDAGKLLSQDKVRELLQSPVFEPVELHPPRTEKLEGPAILNLARKAHFRVGWLYRCFSCNRWHLDLAGGYAIDKRGAIATCYHCLEPDSETKESYLIAVDSEEKVYAVSSILAAHEELDAAVIRLAAATTEPLPLQDHISPGETAYLYSEPFGNQGYFSAGIVNRFYWVAGSTGDPNAFADAVRLRMNLSTEWAPGSSGSAVLDARGNMISHVSTIETLRDDEGDEAPQGTMMTLHEGVPARGVMLMLKEAASKEPKADLQ